MKKIKFTIPKNGPTKVEALGVTGDDCLELTRAYEKRLGIQSGERELKPEYHEEVSEVEKVHEGGS